MSKDDTHFRLRLPVDLKDYVRESAQADERSMTSQIVYVLRQHQKAASAPTA